MATLTNTLRLLPLVLQLLLFLKRTASPRCDTRFWLAARQQICCFCLVSVLDRRNNGSISRTHQNFGGRTQREYFVEQQTGEARCTWHGHRIFLNRCLIRRGATGVPSPFRSAQDRSGTSREHPAIRRPVEDGTRTVENTFYDGTSYMAKEEVERLTLKIERWNEFGWPPISMNQTDAAAAVEATAAG